LSAIKHKPFSIDKLQVVNAYKLVKSNAGAPGVDKQSIEQFEKDLKDNLYKVWNRMSSGSYLPPAVRAVPIPKKSGGQRILGVPTVADRVAQTVVKLQIEPALESIFLPDSFGYRPGKSALDAVGVTRKRCWKYEWVLEFDIRKLFDEIPHELLMKAVRKHVQDRWCILYIERWLKAPMQMEDGSMAARDRGTPQGGVVSPLLANLFLHYCFDTWMQRNYSQLPWCRYADDGLVHCRTLTEAEAVKAALQVRLKECGLEMHPDKTKIVYCKDNRRRGNHPNETFDFLGFTFRPRELWNNTQCQTFCGFTPAASKISMKFMRQAIKELNLQRHGEISIDDVAKELNPVLRGFIQYYGRYGAAEMRKLYHYVEDLLIRWAKRKFRRRHLSTTAAAGIIYSIRKSNPRLFAHWSRLKMA
jgi:RNA-directed DNA polymerase